MLLQEEMGDSKKMYWKIHLFTRMIYLTRKMNAVMHFTFLSLQNEKITLERKIKLQSKEIEKEEKEKRLEKLRSQVGLTKRRLFLKLHGTFGAFCLLNYKLFILTLIILG